MSTKISDQLLKECQIQVEGVKIRLTQFISSTIPTDSEVEIGKVLGEFYKILGQIDPIMETIAHLSIENPDDNSGERLLSHDMRNCMMIYEYDLLTALNPNKVLY